MNTIRTSTATRLIVGIGGVALTAVFILIQAQAGFETRGSVAGFTVFMVAWLALAIRLMSIRVTLDEDGTLNAHNFVRTQNLHREDVSGFEIHVSGPAFLLQEKIVARISGSKVVDLEATRRLRPIGAKSPTTEMVSTLENWLRNPTGMSSSP